MSFEVFVQNILNGLTLGSLYALIAIGYTMVYGILRLINFAHGEIFMLGAYFVFWGVTLVGLPWPAATVLAVAVAACIGFFAFKAGGAFNLSRGKTTVFGIAATALTAFSVFWGATHQGLAWPLAIVFAIVLTACTGILVDQVAYRPLRDAPRISALISAIGVSFFLQNVAIVFFKAIPRAVYRPHWLADAIVVRGLHIMPITLVVPVLSVALMLALLYVVYRTKTGLGMRAISKDIETSYLMGVPVNRVIAVTFGIGSALAAASGIMWSLRYPQLQPVMGSIPGFKAFIAAVFGGIGSVQGAVVGGVTLGLIEIMIVAFFPSLAGYKDAFAFILLIGVLLVKPTGLFGQRIEDKV